MSDVARMSIASGLGGPLQSLVPNKLSLDDDNIPAFEDNMDAFLGDEPQTFGAATSALNELNGSGFGSTERISQRLSAIMDDEGTLLPVTQMEDAVPTPIDDDSAPKQKTTRKAPAKKQRAKRAGTSLVNSKTELTSNEIKACLNSTAPITRRSLRRQMFLASTKKSKAVNEELVAEYEAVAVEERTRLLGETEEEEAVEDVDAMSRPGPRGTCEQHIPPCVSLVCCRIA